MTLDATTPYVTYTVAGIGPYAVGWPYVAGAVRVSVRGADGMPVPLATPADWSVSPASTITAGNVTLTPAAATAHAGKQLIIERLTRDEQGWSGNRSSLDKGIETQLDRIVQGQQEMRAGLRRALRATVEVPPFTPGPAGSTLQWNGTGFVPGPSVNEIADAQAAAIEATAAAAYAAAVTMLFQGLAGDGVTDDTARLVEHQAWPWLQYLKSGNYAAPGAIAGLTRPRVLVADDARVNANRIPFLSIADSSVKTLPANHLFVRQVTSERPDSTMVFFQRNADTDDGFANPKALRVKTIVSVETQQNEWAISGEIDTYSNASGTGEVAVSGVANKFGLSSVFAGHFQANDHNKYAAATSVTSIIGAELNLQVVGLDHPTSNSGYGNRRVMDVIARTNETVAGWNTASGNFGAGEVGIGIDVRGDNETDGYFRFGIVVRDGVSNPNPTGTGIMIDTAGQYGLHLKGANSGAHIFSISPAAYGAIFAGAYTSGTAIRIASGQHIAMEGTNVIRMAHGVTANIWGFYNGAAERIGLDMTATPGIRVAGTQVLAARRTGWAAATGTATRSTFATSTVTLQQLAERVKALTDDLIAHGLIGA